MDNRKKTCPVCGTSLSGRSDKQFCSTACKNEYHNSLARAERKRHKKTFDGLNRNFSILKNCMKTQRRSFRLEELEEQGFDPELFTGHSRALAGFNRYRCLDISYILDSGIVFNICQDEVSDSR